VTSSSSSAAVADEESLVWSLPSSVQVVATERLKVSVVANDEYLFLIGGFYPLNEGGEAISSTKVLYFNGTYSHREDSEHFEDERASRSCFNHHLRRSFHRCCGGLESLNSPAALSTVEVLDIESGEWKLEVESLPLPCGRASLAVYQTGIAIICDGSDLVMFFSMLNGSISMFPSLSESCDGTLGSVDDYNLVVFCSQNLSLVLDPVSGWTTNTKVFGWDGFELQLQDSMKVTLGRPSG